MAIFYQLKYFLICKTHEANKTAQLPYEKLGKPYFSFWEKKKGRIFLSLHLITGADYGARTRHLNLGKVALYQMS